VAIKGNTVKKSISNTFKGKWMRVTAINGSPRKKGNTARALGWVEDELRAKGHLVEHIHIDDYKLEGCVGCYKCQQDPEELVCSRQDAGVEIFERMKESDAIIYATPLYCWGFTSQIKPLIDRHLAFVSGYGDPETYKSHIEGKRVSLLVTAAGPEGAGNSDTITEIFKRLMDYTKARVVAQLIVPYCTTPDNLGEEQKTKARAFADQVIG
jgi:multimeric flavodoxin WrbA